MGIETTAEDIVMYVLLVTKRQACLLYAPVSRYPS